MLPEEYLDLKAALLEAGYAEEIDWAETVGPPKDAENFFWEYGWVVVNSGMKNQVAATIWRRIKEALSCGLPVSAVFFHPGKSKALQEVFHKKEDLFHEYLAQPQEAKVHWLEKLPWIGRKTKYHLAKNFGLDFCKPDRHLVRIANMYGKTPDELCSGLAQATGDRIGTVDLVIWRAANLRMI